MSDYNFDDGDNEFGETIRLDGISDKVQKIQENSGSQYSDEDKFRKFVREENEREMLHERVKEHSNVNSDRSEPPRITPHSNIRSSSTNKSSQKRPSSQKNKPSVSKNNKQYKIFMLLAIIGGIIIFLGMFALVYNNINSGKNLVTPEVETPVASVTQVNNFFALVKNINSGKEISYYDINDDKNNFIKADTQTVITDISGNKMALSDISVGDIVKITSDDTGGIAKEIKYTNEVFKKEKISGFILDKALRTISIDGNTFMYNDETIVQYENKPFDISKLDSTDTLTIKGHKKNIWNIELNEYHGSIIVKNKEKITNGTITIDSKSAVNLSDTDKITVTGGAHNVVIKGSNIETSTQDIYVASGEEYEIDLSNTQTKTGVIVIKSNVSDYVLSVNGNAVAESGEPLVLTPGEYTLKIIKEGYLPWEQKVTLSESSMEVTATLEVEILHGNVSILTEPSGGYVYVDDVYIGISPILIKLTYGEHRLFIKTDGYENVNAPITVNKPEDVVRAILIEASNENAGVDVLD